MARGLMSGEERAVFAPFLTENRSRGGRSPRDHRCTLDGIFRIARTGAPWRDLPEEFGLPAVPALDAVGCVGGDSGRCRSGCGGPADDRQHDHPRAPLCGRRKRGTHRQGLGRSRGGFTTRRHADTNAEGFPLGLPITAGETHDAKAAVRLIESVAQGPFARLGDQGYDTDDIRSADWSRGTQAMSPSRSNRKLRITVDHAPSSLCNRIERYFNEVKNARGVATRYDKLAASFLAFVEITPVRYWRRFVNRA